MAKSPKISVTNELIERGLRHLYGELLGNKIKDDIKAEKRRKAFIRQLEKLAKEKGYHNIAQFFE
jgi:hypothetical protein